MKEFLATAKALSDENRVRALMFLRDGELCVCQIIEMLGRYFDQESEVVSEQLATLEQMVAAAEREQPEIDFTAIRQLLNQSLTYSGE